MVSCVKQSTAALGSRWGVMAVTSVAVFMALLDVTVVNIAFPDLGRSFPAASLAGLSWVINAYGVVFAAALVPAGRMADRFGRKRLFMAGVVVFVGGSAGCALAPSVAALVVARAVQAVGAALLMPTSLGLVLAAFPARLRPVATGVWTSIGAVAAAAGPSAGGLLVQWQGWRAVFVINVVLGAVALPFAWRVLREARDESVNGWPDLVGSALVAAAVGAVALGLTQAPSWGWGSPRLWVVLAGAAIALVAMLVRSGRHPRPVVDLGLFRIRSFALANSGVFVFGAGFFAILLLNVLFLTDIWHYSILRAGGALTPGPLAAALVAPGAGQLVTRYGAGVIAVGGTVLFAGAAVALAAGTGVSPRYWTGFLPWALVSGVGVGLSLPAFSAAVVAGLAPQRFATGSAVLACARQIGGVVGVATLVTALGTTPVAGLERFHRAWLLVAAIGLVAALLSLALSRVGQGGLKPRKPTGFTRPPRGADLSLGAMPTVD
jgi:EmrB/QacA subfamily drug resistance transporter